MSLNTLHRFLPSPGGPSHITLRYRSLTEAVSQTLQLSSGVCEEILQVLALPRRREAAVCSTSVCATIWNKLERWCEPGRFYFILRCPGNTLPGAWQPPICYLIRL